MNPSPSSGSAPRGYKDISLCGSGATSRVYRAVEEASGREVALKRLHRQMVRSTDALTRLRRELQSLSALNHPGIVKVFDVIRWGGDPTIVMEFIAGEDLKERIVRSGPMPFAEVESLARAILDILASTHAAGIVHRDLKPQNIRLTPDGRVFLLDFGSARLCAASELTATGTTVGTPEYMAPELFAGSVYDPRVDIYGLGATLHECLTGRAPQEADSLANLAFLRTQVDIPPVSALRPDTPVALANLVDRCLARAPEERFASAALAAWAVDHPAESQALAARRSAHPPCLHCHTPIPPESALCSRCHSDHPFSYASGPAHVRITRVAEPSRLMEWVAQRFPQRAHPDHLHRLAQRCAALSSGPQRLVSFIAPKEARALVHELGAHGVTADMQLEQRRPLAGFFVFMGLVYGTVAVLAALSSSAHGAEERLPVLGGIGLFLGAFLLALHLGGSALSVWLAGRGLLSRSTRRPIMLPGFALATCMSAFMGGLFIIPSTSMFYFIPTMSLLVMASVLALICRYHGVPGPVAESPEPGAWQQFRAAASLRKVRAEDVVVTPVKPMGFLAQLIVLLAFVAMVPFEIWAIIQMGAAWESWKAHPTVVAAPAPQPVPAAPIVPDPQTPPAPPRHSSKWVQELPGKLLALTPPAFAILAMLLVLRRRKRIQVDGAALFSELDLAAFRRLSQRTAPSSRSGCATMQPADTLIRADVGDAFSREAIRRAADLARLLPKDAVLRLSGAIDAMKLDTAEAKLAEASLLARCIAETDPAQKARFEFLALEGRMEMEAAQAWAAQLKEKAA